MQNYKSFILAGVVLFCCSFFNSCYYDTVLPEPVDLPDNQNNSFSQDIIPIFNQSCNLASCHNAGGEHPDLSPAVAYNSLISDEDLINLQDPASSELYQWVTGNGTQTMPITGTDPLIAAKILAWIKQGAQNN